MKYFSCALQEKKLHQKNSFFSKLARFFVPLPILVFLPGLLYSVEVDVVRSPKIEEFRRTDINFLQLQAAVKENDKLFFAQKKTVPEFFVYECGKKDNLLSLASSTGIPYDTLSTVNSMPSVSSPLEGKNVVIPTVKGLFVSEKPGTSVEILLYKEHKDSLESAPFFKIGERKFYFLEGKRFSPYQRLFFLDSAFTLPLDSKTITSEFGLRKSPVYGTWKQHNGIDFAAKVGDNVYACKGGTVTLAKKNDVTFGNYIIMTHDGGLTSVYAHLSEIYVKHGDVVNGRDIIGKSGDTGQVTGPHLHFEIRRNGNALDPRSLLPV